jgi:hypothetical protein
MTLSYSTICNGCGKKESSWPEGNPPLTGWVSVNDGDNRFDYCGDCWQKVLALFELSD